MQYLQYLRTRARKAASAFAATLILLGGLSLAGASRADSALVDELSELFRGHSLSEIDNAFSAYKERRAAEMNQFPSFDKQVATLIARGYPDAAGMSEDRFRSYLNPLEEKFQTGDVIVVPAAFVSVPKQMSLVVLDGRNGYADINPGELYADPDTIQHVPYIIRDVDTGGACLGVSANECAERFKAEGRSGFTAEEGIAVLIQKPEILRIHFIDLPGSRRGGGGVASFWLSVGGPLLLWGWAGSSGAKWGSASCGSRVGP